MRAPTFSCCHCYCFRLHHCRHCCCCCWSHSHPLLMVLLWQLPSALDCQKQHCLTETMLCRSSSFCIQYVLQVMFLPGPPTAAPACAKAAMRSSANGPAALLHPQSLLLPLQKLLLFLLLSSCISLLVQASFLLLLVPPHPPCQCCCCMSLRGVTKAPVFSCCHSYCFIHQVLHPLLVLQVLFPLLLLLPLLLHAAAADLANPHRGMPPPPEAAGGV